MELITGWRSNPKGGGGVSCYHTQIRIEESMMVIFITNMVFIFAGAITVLMPYSLKNLQLVVLVLGTHSSGGEARVGTSMDEIMQAITLEFGTVNWTFMIQYVLNAIYNPSMHLRMWRFNKNAKAQWKEPATGQCQATLPSFVKSLGRPYDNKIWTSMWYGLCIADLFILPKTGNNHRSQLARSDFARINQTLPRNAILGHGFVEDFAVSLGSFGKNYQSPMLYRMLEDAGYARFSWSHARITRANVNENMHVHV